MIRTKTKHRGNVSAILTADWHLQETVPVCRTDNFEEAQWRKVDFVSDLQKQYDCPVLHSGDLYNYWKPSPYLISKTIEHLPARFWSVYGNHDLPQHSLELLHKCGMFTLEKAKAVQHYAKVIFENFDLYMVNCGEIPPVSLTTGPPNVLLWHVYTYSGTPPYPGATTPARALLHRYPEYQLIVTGDNHLPFVLPSEDRLLVNPGSLMRTDADQVDHRPRIYLWYAESNTVEPVYIPIEEGVVSREHIEKTEQRNERIEAFISRLDGEWKASMSFEDNLEQFMKVNEITPRVMEIILKAIDNG